MKKINIGVIGTGAVGCIIASSLSTQNNFEVEFAYSKHKGINIDGLIEIDVIKPGDDISSLVKCVDTPDMFTSKKDIIFVVCKSTHMEEYTKNIKNYLAKNGFVVMLNNMLVRKCLTSKLPVNKIVGMFIEWSCIKLNDYQCEIINQGPTAIGVYSKDAEPLAKLVCRILSKVTNTVYLENFNEFVLGRIILNSAIASVGALSGLDLGHFLENKFGRKLFVELIKESYFAYCGVGITPTDYDGKLDYDIFCADTFYSKLYRKRILHFLGKFNSKTYSSILYDLQNNKSI